MRTLLWLVVFAIVGCAWDVPSPSATRPTRDNPCGNLGVPCFDMAGNYAHLCCTQGESCCGGKWSVCREPLGTCEDIRETPEMAPRGDGGISVGGGPVRAYSPTWRP